MNSTVFLGPWCFGILLLLWGTGVRAEPFDVFVRFSSADSSILSVGGSTDPEFPGTRGWIQLVGFEKGARGFGRGISQSGASSSRISGSPLDLMTLEKPLDESSPALFHTCTLGKSFDSFLMVVRTNGPMSGSNARPFYYARAETVTILGIEWTYDTDGAPLESLTLETGALQWTIQSMDDAGSVKSTTAHWEPGDPRSTEGPLPGVVLTPTTLPVASQGRPYRQVFALSGFAVPPYDYWINGGMLPEGMSLSRDGVLSGTPRHTGPFTLKLAGGDFYGNFAEHTYSFVVSGRPRLRLLDASDDGRDWRVHLEGTPGVNVRIESASSITGPWRPEGVALEVPVIGFLEMSLKVDSAPAKFFRAAETSTGCPPLPAGLRHWWRGESDVDLIEGEPLATVGKPDVAPGIIGDAFFFDGKDDRRKLLEEGQPGSLIPSGWTLAVWVRRSDSLDASSALLLDSHYAVKLEQYGLPARQVGITWFGHWDRRFTYSAPISQWVHLVLTDTSGGTTLYVNGQFKETIPDRIALPLSLMGGGHGDRLRGGVDEVLVFDRALSRSEIAELYQSALKLGNCDPAPTEGGALE